MRINLLVGIAFVALALFFFGLAWRDYRREQGRLTISAKTRLRLALIFLAVGLGLSCLSGLIR